MTARALHRVYSSVALLFLLGAPLCAVHGQSIRISTGDGSTVQATPGTKLRVPITVDLSQAGNLTLASLQAGVTWDPDRLTFDSIRVVPASGFSQSANVSGAASGGLVFNAFSTGSLEASGPLTNLHFTVGSTVGSAAIVLSPSAAGSEAGDNILGRLLVQNLAVCVAGGSGRWGDVNNDGTVNIIDAQQIARYSVGLGVANLAAVSERGDVNADGTVNIIDAQQVARFSVALSAAARINTPVPGALGAIAAVSVAPGQGRIEIGESTTLSAELRDAANNPVSGCAEVVWSSGSSAVATVSASGVVTGVGAGSTTITASSGGKSGSVTITVTAPQAPVATVTVAPGASFMAVGETVQLTATPRDVAGSVLGGRSVTWSTSNALVVLVSSSGLVTVAGAGTATITAIVEGVSATASLVATAPTSGSLGGAGAAILATGGGHSCALATTGTAYCWGWNQHGQLGDGTTTARNAPVAVSGGVPFVSIAVGDSHSCGISSAGAAFCWGRNSFGQLGSNDTLPSTTPRLVQGALQFTSITASTSGTCGLTTEGAAYCWGLGGNVSGSNLVSVRVPTRVSETLRFTRLTMGSSSACGLTAIGEAYCWGQGSWGVRGDGISTSAATGPTAVRGGHRFAAVSASGVRVCAITPSGAGYCWGQNPVGDSTETARAIPTRVSGGHVWARLEPGNGGACGLTVIGRALCWGSNTGNGAGDFVRFPVVVAGGLTFREIDAGDAHSCGSTSTGALYCWGQNFSGQLGTGGSSTALQPTPVSGGVAFKTEATAVAEVAIVPESPVVYINRSTPLVAIPRSAGGGLLAGRSVAWSSASPTVATVSGSGVATGVSSGSVVISAAVEGRSGTAAAQVHAAAVAFVQVSPSNPTLYDEQTVQLTAAVLDSLGGSLSGRGVTWASTDTLVARVNAQGLVTVVGAGSTTVEARSEGKVGSTTITGRLRRVASIAVAPTTASLAVGAVLQVVPTLRDSVGAVLSGRSVTWNSSASSVATVSASGGITALVTGTATITATSASLSATVTVTVSGGAATTPDDGPTLTVGYGDFACGVSTAGPVHCWGKNNLGQLGDGTTLDRNTPAPVAGNLALATVSAGYDHVCGLTSAGLAVCWGSDRDGQLGNGPGASNTAAPSVVTGALPYRAIAAGGYHTCALAASGAAHCWGNNIGGQLGDGTTAFRDQPVAVSGGLTFTRLETGSGHSCGLTASGTLYCWGSNSLGQLGTGNTVSVSVPTRVAGEKTFTDITLGVQSTCAIGTDGRSYCWGWNELGQVGDGTVGNRLQPTEVVGGLTFGSLSSDWGVTCGLTTGGRAFCWGANSAGQLGDGTWTAGGSPPKSAPVAVATDEVFRQLSRGISAYRCALTATGQAYCWPALVGGGARTPTPVSGTPTFKVTSAEVATVSVTPTSASRRVGESLAVSAVPRDASGRALVGRAISWSSSNASVATVSQSGTVTGLGAGSVTITATSEGRNGTATITFILPPVASVTISPSSVVTTVGLTTQLAATPVDSAGLTLGGRSVAWSSSAAGVATVSGAGLVTAVAPGSATITATVEGRSATSTVMVASPPPVATIALESTDVSLLIDGARQLSATTLDAAANPLGRQVTWSSSNPAVAAVTSSGLVTANGIGSAIISASSEGKTGNVTVVVSVAPEPVDSVLVSPPTLALAPGQAASLAVVTKDSLGELLTGRLVTWSSSAPGVAAVSSTGRVTAVSNGSATITATSEGRAGVSSVSVSTSAQPVSRVEVTPSSAGLLPGQSLTLGVTPRDAENTPVGGRNVTWTSSAPSVATVSNSGVVTGIGNGTTRITAISEGVSGSATISIAGNSVSSITLAPGVASLLVGGAVQLAPTLKDTNGVPLTGRQVIWMSSNVGVATVTSTGIVQGVSLGTVTITATVEGRTASATIAVTTPVSVAQVLVSPDRLSMSQGQNITLTATLRDVSGNVVTDRTVAWESTNTFVATVNNATGMVSAGIPGTATIRATIEGVTGSATVTVTETPVPTTTVRITPGVVAVPQGKTYQFIATALDAAGNELPGKTFTWRSSNPAAAPITSGGVLTATALGVYDVLATTENRTATATVNIVPPAVASITVSPRQSLKIVGQTVELAATLRDSTGALVAGRPRTWSSTNPGVATVTTTTGVVSAVAPGSANILVRADGETGSATVNVIFVPVKSVTVSPPTATAQAKRTVRFTAAALDSAAVPITGGRLAGRGATWATSDTMKAVVDATGLVTTRAEGNVDILATIDGITGKAVITITRPAPATVDVTPNARNLAIGQSVQLTAAARDSFNQALTGRSFSWASSSAGNATVNQSGLVTAVAWGAPTIAASTEGTTGKTVVVVTDTLWRKIATLPPALAGQPLGDVAYDYQSGTIFLHKATFDGAIWQRDQLNTWRQVTPPQSTFGACATLHFDSVSRDLLVAACDGRVWRIGVSDGLVSTASSLEPANAFWEPASQRFVGASRVETQGQCVISWSPISFNGGAPRNVAWNPETRTVVQSSLGHSCLAERTRSGRTIRGRFFFTDQSLYLKRGDQDFVRLQSNWIENGWFEDANTASRTFPIPDLPVAYCVGGGVEAIWRLNSRTRLLDRFALSGGGPNGTTAYFTSPQAETQPRTTRLLCDGARNQLWVIESTQEGGGIWRYLGGL